jgi:hypothetical protein
MRAATSPAVAGSLISPCRASYERAAANPRTNSEGAGRLFQGHRAGEHASVKVTIDQTPRGAVGRRHARGYRRHSALGEGLPAAGTRTKTNERAVDVSTGPVVGRGPGGARPVDTLTLSNEFQPFRVGSRIASASRWSCLKSELASPHFFVSFRQVLCYSRPRRRVKAIWLNLEPSSEFFSTAVRRMPIGENLPFSACGIASGAPNEPVSAAQSRLGARATAIIAVNAPQTARFALRDARWIGPGPVNLGVVEKRRGPFI